MITKLDVYQELDEVRRAVRENTHLFDEQGVITVTHRPEAEEPNHDLDAWLPEGVRERDFNVINENFRGTAIEDLLLKLPFQFGRSRLIIMPPKACISIHWDSGKRYHYAVETNPSCYLIEMRENSGVFHHIPADGYVYEMDARMTHSAMNASKKPRIHLVVSDASDEGLNEGQPQEHVAHYSG